MQRDLIATLGTAGATHRALPVRPAVRAAVAGRRCAGDGRRAAGAERRRHGLWIAVGAVCADRRDRPDAGGDEANAPSSSPSPTPRPSRCSRHVRPGLSRRHVSAGLAAAIVIATVRRDGHVVAEDRRAAPRAGGRRSTGWSQRALFALSAIGYRARHSRLGRAEFRAGRLDACWLWRSASRAR